MPRFVMPGIGATNSPRYRPPDHPIDAWLVTDDNVELAPDVRRRQRVIGVLQHWLLRRRLCAIAVNASATRVSCDRRIHDRDCRGGVPFEHWNSGFSRSVRPAPISCSLTPSDLDRTCAAERTGMEAAIPRAGCARALRLPTQPGSVGQATAVPSARAIGPRRVHLGFRRAGNEGRPGFTVPLSSFGPEMGWRVWARTRGLTTPRRRIDGSFKP